MIIHFEIFDKIANHPRWNLNAVPHEANRNHLGYGDIHISLLALHKPKNILAVGSQYGFIPAILGVMAKSYGGHVDFVDANYDQTIIGHEAYGGLGYWIPEHQHALLTDFDLQDTLQFHIETTQQFFEKNKKRYQYAYLDGNHSYEGVRHDFEQARLCCDSGSFITLHDAKVESGWKGIQFGVKQFLETVNRPHIVIGTFPGLAIVQL